MKWRGERVPLVRWRTTVGGWRAELASDGQEYYRYKGSDVGPRVWRHIVAAPVWIPPPSSPLGSMVKEKRVNGTLRARHQLRRDRARVPVGLRAGGGDPRGDAQGPERACTYFDNGIRTHGSFDYMSLRGRFSHGCHRLYNNLAVRLFSVRARAPPRADAGVDRARLPPRRSGGRGEVFEMRLPSRGFYYELDPPLPVEVLEGRIKGTRQKPIAGYVRKPGVKYASRRPPSASRRAREQGRRREAP